MCTTTRKESLLCILQSLKRSGKRLRDNKLSTMTSQIANQSWGPITEAIEGLEIQFPYSPPPPFTDSKDDPFEDLCTALIKLISRTCTSYCDGSWKSEGRK